MYKIRNFGKKLKNNLLKQYKKLRQFVLDPPVDMIMAGMFGSLLGRVFFYLWLISVAILAQIYFAAMLLIVTLSVDITVHSAALKVLMHLLRLELLTTKAFEIENLVPYS